MCAKFVSKLATLKIRSENFDFHQIQGGLCCDGDRCSDFSAAPNFNLVRCRVNGAALFAVDFDHRVFDPILAASILAVEQLDVRDTGFWNFDGHRVARARSSVAHGLQSAVETIRRWEQTVAILRSQFITQRRDLRWRLGSNKNTPRYSISGPAKVLLSFVVEVLCE